MTTRRIKKETIYSGPQGVGFVVGEEGKDRYSFLSFGRAESETVEAKDIRSVSPNTLERIKLDPAFRAWAKEQRSKR
jgi:hypothetical protein